MERCVLQSKKRHTWGSCSRHFLSHGVHTHVLRKPLAHCFDNVEPLIAPPLQHSNLQCNINLESIDIYCSHGAMLAILPVELLLRVLYFQEAIANAVAIAFLHRASRGDECNERLPEGTLGCGVRGIVFVSSALCAQDIQIIICFYVLCSK